MRLQCSAAVLFTAALIAGCGDEALTQAEYVKQADAICTDYAGRQEKLGSPKTIKDIARVADQTKPLIEERLSKLRDLAAPDAIKDDANAAYDLVEKQIPKIDELKAAAEKNDTKKIQAIAASASKLDEQAKAKTKAIGLKVCGASAN